MSKQPIPYRWDYTIRIKTKNGEYKQEDKTDVDIVRYKKKEKVKKLTRLKNFILLFIILIVCGCSTKEVVKQEEANDTYRSDKQKIEFYSYCDEKYNVEYMVFTQGDRAGMTIRVDENGNIIHCDN